MPLPQELRNRIKAFIDICVDRLSRGLGGVLLLLLTTTSLDLGVKGISVVVMILCLPWIYFSYLAKREYVATIKRRFESRRLDLESARVSVQDATTLRFLEGVVSGDNPRQAAYALRLLADAPGYDARPVVMQAAESPDAEVREEAYRLASAQRYEGLKVDQPRTPASIAYVLAFSPDRPKIARELLDNPDPAIVGAALEALREDRELAGELVTREWLHRIIDSGDPQWRALAARAIGDPRRPGNGGAASSVRRSGSASGRGGGARGRGAEESRLSVPARPRARQLARARRCDRARWPPSARKSPARFPT